MGTRFIHKNGRTIPIHSDHGDHQSGSKPGPIKAGAIKGAKIGGVIGAAAGVVSLAAGGGPSGIVMGTLNLGAFGGAVGAGVGYLNKSKKGRK